MAYAIPVCTFRITATNIGNAKFPGPIQIVDFPSAIKSSTGETDIKAEVVSVTMVGSLAQGSCKKPGNIWCDINTGLEPGASETFELTMKAGITDFTGDNCVLRRDVLAGTEAPVCVPMQGLRHNGPNLVIDKEAPNATTPGGTGHCGLTQLCTFQITIKNIGDAPFTGALHLKDTVGPGVPVRILKGSALGRATRPGMSRAPAGSRTRRSTATSDRSRRASGLTTRYSSR